MGSKPTRVSARARKTKNSQLKDAFVAKAKAAHDEIVKEVQEISSRWTKLARKVEEFREKNYHQAITNPKTGKPFRNFAKWAKSVFGKSESTIFAHARLVRQLTGVLRDEDMEGTRKENLEQMVRLKKAGKLDSAAVEAGKKLPARSFRKEVEQRLPAEDRRPVLEQIGPYQVSAATAEHFGRALTVAEWVVEEDDGELPVRDRALEALATSYLEGHQVAYDAAHTPKRKANLAAKPPLAVSASA